MSEIIIVHILLGASLWPAAILYKLFPPKKINKWYGFRTKTSMKDQKLWEAGNRISADFLLAIAILTNMVQLATYFLMPIEASIITSAVFLSTAVILMIPFTNKKLKEIERKSVKRNKRDIT